MVWIKKLVIKGFESYKDETIEEFDKEVNVFVGANGSGKSTIFRAICFVLNDIELQGTSTRSHLHAPKQGEAMTSASVELYFDNESRRFPLDKDEVVLRRSIALKKDEFFIDHKRATKEEVNNMLESAGFSASNPYYVVRQARVMEISNQSPQDIWRIVKDVAGAKLYETRRTESNKLLDNANKDIKKIDESLTEIEKTLKDLESERSELLEYQAKDKQRRALEYAILDRESNEAAEGLKKIEQERGHDTEKAKDVYESMKTVRDEQLVKNREIKTLQTENVRLSSEKDQIDKVERQELIKQRAQAELTSKDLKAKIQVEKQSQTALNAELTQLHKDRKTKQSELTKTDKEFTTQDKAVKEVTETLSAKERRVRELLEKVGRSSQFKSTKDRDAWLKEEIKTSKPQIASRKKALDELTGEIKDYDSRISENAKTIGQRRSTLDDHAKNLEKDSRVLGEKQQSRDELNNTRKDLWKKSQEMEEKLNEQKQDLLKNERVLQSTMNKAISSGLAAVRRIRDEHKISGVYGPVIELLETDDVWMTAVEVAAGPSLFHIVVDTDATASKMLEIMRQEKAGRVTFIPLNQLIVKPHAEKATATENSFPMIDKLNFKPVVKKAFQALFSKVWICEDLDIGRNLAKDHGLTCITLEGDQVNKRGALVGGFLDMKESRLRAMKSIKELRKSIDKTNTELKKLKAQSQELDQQINTLLGEMQKLELTRSSVRDTYEQARLDVHALQSELDSQREIVEDKRKSQAALSTTLKQLEDTTEAYQKEIGTELFSQLSSQERSELTALNQEVADLKEQLIKSSTQKAALMTTKSSLETLLQRTMTKREEQINEELASFQIDARDVAKATVDRELERIETTLGSIKGRIGEIDGKIEKNQQAISKLREDLEKVKAREDEQKKLMQGDLERMEKVLNQRNLLLLRKENNEKKIREIGAIPMEEVEKIKGKNLSALQKQLREVIKVLQGFTTLNEKAAIQYTDSATKKEQLTKRKEEIEKSKESIENFGGVLEEKKLQALERTVKQTAANFTKIWKYLTGGVGDINLVPENATMANITGLSFDVSFSEKGSMSFDLNQLSGGQKTLVALALIFAIQACDPAPFYLFDEVDAALDGAYRKQVASYIKEQPLGGEAIQKQAGTPQHLLTSFRPELVEVADKRFVVTSNQGISSVRVAKKREALGVVAEAEKDKNNNNNNNNNNQSNKKRKLQERESEEEDN